MTTLDGSLPADDEDASSEPIGRVNIRPSDNANGDGGWSLRAVLFGLIALAVMVVVLIVVLQGVFEPMPA